VSDVRIEGTELVIDQSLVDKVLSLKSDLRFPLAHVVDATWDPGIAKEPKGLRAPGTSVPGVITAGTYHHDGETSFWNIRHGTNVVVIRLRDEEFDRLVLEVDDPQSVVHAINRARPNGPAA